MGTAQDQYREQRKHPRYTCNLGVELRVGDSNAGCWGTLADICLGGCYVNTFSPLPLETPVTMVVKNKNLEINMAGKVVTSHPGVGMGIQFAGSTQTSDEAELKILLEDLAHTASE